MRFGLQLPSYGPVAGPEAIAAAATRAEQLGFDSLWTSDHVLVPSRIARFATIYEAMTTLVWAAAHTERIRLGPSVVILPQRDPVLAAKQLAMVDVLSGGRLIAGLGAGYVEEEFAFLGARYAGRGATLERHLEVMRALWAGETDYAGESASFADARFGPLPVQGERIPIWLGGNSAPALRRAARIADAWHPGYLGAEALAAKVGELRELAGERRVEVAIKLRVSTGPGDDLSPDAPAPDVGGTPAQVRDQLRRYEEAGADHAVVVFPVETRAAFERELESFAAEAMPA
ncbi:MAG TPA: TIGR03619 family F420-dependent LLM class oxidoreductase [Solirubrobacterales bacterium]